LFSSGWICGVGMNVYEHPRAEGKKPSLVLSLIEDHLPPLVRRTWYEHLLEEPSKAQDESEKKAECSPEAWVYFTQFSHTPENREWLKRYRMPMGFEKFRYNY